MKKSQGEIFGLALIFTILIIGFLIYSKFSVGTNKDIIEEKQREYNDLSYSYLNSILEISTLNLEDGTYLSVKDLIKHCLYQTYFDTDVAYLSNGLDSCEEQQKTIENSLENLFGKNNFNLGPTPYMFKTYVEKNPNSVLHNLTITNFGEIEYDNTTITESNYRKWGFLRANSREIFDSSQGIVEINLYLYFK